MQIDYQDIYNGDPIDGSGGGSNNTGGAALNPGDPGTYYGSDNVWYGPDGQALANQGRNPDAPPPVPRRGPAPPPSPDPTTPPAPPNLGGGALAPFSEPAPDFPTYPAFQRRPDFQPTTFTQPTLEQAMSAPGYKFRVQQGEDSLQNWAAARGTLNGSDTAKALIDYGQSAAEQGYASVYAQDFGAWQANEADRFGAWSANEATDERAYGLNRQTQSIDPWTAAYNAWAQRGNFYLNNQGTVANTALGFAQLG